MVGCVLCFELSPFRLNPFGTNISLSADHRSASSFVLSDVHLPSLLFILTPLPRTPSKLKGSCLFAGIFVCAHLSASVITRVASN